jgi:hypothetical protein
MLKTAAKQVFLAPEELHKINAYWRAFFAWSSHSPIRKKS